MRTTVCSARMPENLAKALDEIAAERRRTPSDILREAFEHYVQEWADYEIAAARMNDPADPVLTEEEFKAELGWDL